MEHIETSRKKLQGFATLPKQRRIEIARAGGLAAARKGTGHRWTSEEAKAAGEIGGKRSRRRPKNVTTLSIDKS